MSISTLENREKWLFRDIESLNCKIQRLAKSKQKSARSNLLKAQTSTAKKCSYLGVTQQKIAKERKCESDKSHKEQYKHLKQIKAAQKETSRLVCWRIKTKNTISSFPTFNQTA